MKLLAAVVGSVLLLAGCSHPSVSPKARMLSEMHKLVPNVPSDYIASDANQVCTHTRRQAIRGLLDDAMALNSGVDGLDLETAALRHYATRLVVVVHTTGYCTH